MKEACVERGCSKAEMEEVSCPRHPLPMKFDYVFRTWRRSGSNFAATQPGLGLSEHDLLPPEVYNSIPFQPRSPWPNKSSMNTCTPAINVGNREELHDRRRPPFVPTTDKFVFIPTARGGAREALLASARISACISSRYKSFALQNKRR